MKTLFIVSFILVLLNMGCKKEEQVAQMDSATSNQLQSDLTAARTANALIVMWHDSAVHCIQSEFIRHCDSMMCIYDSQFHLSCSMFSQHHSNSMSGSGMMSGGGMMGGGGSGMSGNSSCSGNMQQMMDDMQSLQTMHAQHHPDCSGF